MTSGQIFRVNKNEIETNDNFFVYDLYSMSRHLRISTGDFLNYEFSCTKNEFESYYKIFFDLKVNYDTIKPLKSDKFLKKCIDYGCGIRILRQDPYEMLISFIISQRKSIPAIRTSIERLCKNCGKKINDKYGTYYTFPSPKEILKNKKYLSKCGLGYRVPYIIDACEKVISGEINLKKKDVSIDYLMKIKGVGIKVASCVMLFSYHDLTCVPIDVWMKRVLDKYYGGSLPKQYIKNAGIIQQYLFNYAKDFGV